MSRKKDNSLHWADKIAELVKARVEKDPRLKKIVKKQGYLVYDEKTPSGSIHIGSGRGWIIHDIIAKAMRDQGMKAKFVLSSDDIDPFDKMNKELPKEYEKYLGMPFRDMPSPVKGYKSFADYYFMQCVEKFEEFGIQAEVESTGELYDSGAFNPYIKIALDNTKKIQEIYVRLYGEETVGASRIPFNMVCDKCGKIATTVAVEWNKEKELVKYECREDFVTWAKGCGHSDWKSPYNGGGKFPWKVEWAAKWPTKGVVYEIAGKDHFTKGGSRTCANAICVEVFNYPPPYPSERYSTGKGYEFFTIGGAKMSTSKGKGMGFVDSTEYAPAQMLRYLLVKSRPHAVVDFDPFGTNDLILLYERYDQTERVYFGKEKLNNEHEEQKHKRIYELSHVGKIPDKIPLQVSFSNAAIVIQVGLNEDGAIEILKSTGHIPKDATKKDLEYVRDRLKFAKSWVENFAPEQYKFKLQTKVDKETKAKLSDGQKKALKNVADFLKVEKRIDDKELHNYFYDNAREVGIEPKDFFKAAYNVLIKRDRGPKLASFILSLGEKAVKLFESI